MGKRIRRNRDRREVLRNRSEAIPTILTRVKAMQRTAMQDDVFLTDVKLRDFIVTEMLVETPICLIFNDLRRFTD